MKTVYSKDTSNKKMLVTREFTAPIELTWKAWTDKNILDEWWAPKPWKTETKTLNFKNGSYWLYAMVGPNAERHWCRTDFKNIDPLKRFSATVYFCDEEGNKNADLPTQYWTVGFSKTNSGTKVVVELTFATEKELQAIIEMGFEEGFASAHNNLDELLAKEVHAA